MTHRQHVHTREEKAICDFIACLKPLGINHFEHDITFGNGKFQVLAVILVFLRFIKNKSWPPYVLMPRAVT